MIKLYTLIFALAFSMGSLKAQHKDEIEKAATISRLPLSLKKTTFAEIADLKGYYDQLFINDSPAYRLYRDGKILLSLLDLEVPIKTLRKTLAQEKRIVDERLAKDSRVQIEKSEITEINGINYLIVKYKIGNDNLATFLSEYNDKNQHVYGILHSKPAEKKKADEIFTDFLKALTIKI